MLGKSKYYFDINRNRSYNNFKKNKRVGPLKILKYYLSVIAAQVFCYRCQN